MTNNNPPVAPLSAETDRMLLNGLTGEPQPAQYGDLEDVGIAELFRDDVAGL